MIVVFRHFFYRNYVGLTLWPFIFLKNRMLRSDAVLINHERIHLRQQAEMLVVFFYLWYVLEWVLRSIYHMNFYMAYRNISFEREAYAHERDMQYLESRRPYQFLTYLNKAAQTI